MVLNRQIWATDFNSKPKSKSNFGIYKDLNLKSKFGSQTIEYPFVEKQGFTQKHIDFGKVISGPLERKNKKMLIKNPEFVIPKDVKRQSSEDRDLLSKYLKDNSAVQSHTIHISELMNTSSKNTASKERVGSGASRGKQSIYLKF